MKIEEFKNVLRLSHRWAVRETGKSPPGMESAIDALPDMKLIRDVPTIPPDIIEWIERSLSECSDYKDISP